MKIKSVHFIAKANINGNRKSNVILTLVCLMVVSFTLISSYAYALTNAVNEYKKDFLAKTLQIYPFDSLLTDDVIKGIKNIEHVKNVFELKGMRNQIFDIVKIEDENGIYKKLQNKIKKKNGYIDTWSLIGDEKIKVVSGKPLDEAPEYSCIIPSLFYPFETDDGNETNLDYINSENLVGKTLTVKTDYQTLYNFHHGENEELNGNDWAELPTVKFKLKIAGVYYSSPTGAGDYSQVFVSEETGKAIQKTAFELSDYNIKSGEDDVAKWYRTSSLHNHYVVVDDFENINYVYSQILQMNVDCSAVAELGIQDGIMAISAILHFGGFFFIFATMVVSIINIIQSTVTALRERKGEIGLLKAIGYKNSQIFSCLYYEHINLSIKGFLLGAVISALFIAFFNFTSMHGDYVDRLYVINWSNYIILLLISLAVVIIVPLICELIGLFKLTKIQPRDAMS